MHISQVESGPLRSGRSGRWPLIANHWASLGGSCRNQRAAPRVRFFCVYYNPDIHLFRLNVHLSSIVMSKPFQMPVEVLPRSINT